MLAHVWTKTMESVNKRQERETFEYKGAVYDCTWEDDNVLIRHGGPWDRGSADSYYRRGANPHFYVGGTGTSDRINKSEMTEEQIEEYYAGYAYNEAQGDYKEY